MFTLDNERRLTGSDHWCLAMILLTHPIMLLWMASPSVLGVRFSASIEKKILDLHNNYRAKWAKGDLSLDERKGQQDIPKASNMRKMVDLNIYTKNKCFCDTMGGV